MVKGWMVKGWMGEGRIVGWTGKGWMVECLECGHDISDPVCQDTPHTGPSWIPEP